ncbi:MAG: hypothetical protein KF861_16245 [Planctomycetaceae bacterium]|nr:hypothetical protein [Planctomycetaceae bacterium]
MSRHSKRRMGGWLLAAVSVLWIGSYGAACGEDRIGGVMRFLFGRGAGGGEARGVINLVVEDAPADFENQFTPLLNKLLSAELHFAHKVCQLNAEQVARLKEVGQVKVAAIAKTYGQQRNQHQSSEWPDARDLLTAAFQEQLDALLPAETAQRYREEMAARRLARDAAAREMILVLMDRRLSLTPEQYTQLDGAISGQRDASWSRNMQMFLYEEYAPMPDDSVVRPLLSDRQRDIWASRTNYGRISFGWEQDLGLMTPWGDLGDIELELPAAQAEPANDATQEAAQEE